MRRRPAIVLLVLLALAGVTAILWTALEWPPPRLILRYGLTPGCEPTGNEVEIEGVEFVEIGPGCFRMGSTILIGGDLLGRACASLGLPWGEQPRRSREVPVHWVEFRRGYWIAKTEVTNAQYRRYWPRHGRRDEWMLDENPLTKVEWEESRNYCRWLGEQSGLPVRLPSEAEWECACRAGSKTESPFGDDEEDRTEDAWPDQLRQANAWGLFNMLGGADEWCEDTWFDSHEGAPSDGAPRSDGGDLNWGNSGSVFRVVRGGRDRSAWREGVNALRGKRDVGFRPAFSNEE